MPLIGEIAKKGADGKVETEIKVKLVESHTIARESVASSAHFGSIRLNHVRFAFWRASRYHLKISRDFIYVHISRCDWWLPGDHVPMPSRQPADWLRDLDS